MGCRRRPASQLACRLPTNSDEDVQLTINIAGCFLRRTTIVVGLNGLRRRRSRDSVSLPFRCVAHACGVYYARGLLFRLTPSSVLDCSLLDRGAIFVVVGAEEITCIVIDERFLSKRAAHHRLTADESTRKRCSSSSSQVYR